MFRKIISQIEIYPDYTTTLSRADFEKNVSKIDLEIKNIEKKYPLHQQIAVNVNFNNKEQTLEDYLKLLKQQKADLEEKKNVGEMYDNSLFQNIGGKNVEVSTQEAQEGLKRDIAALEKQIQVREQTLAEIDNYVVTLLSGEMGQLNIAHTNAKFIKIAVQPTEEEVLESVEEYFDKLYDESEGSPNYGKIMTHPEKHRNELSTEAQTSVARFKKK
jgi:primosomal protein N''